MDDDAPSGTEDLTAEAAASMMDLLAEHVPLTLLADLATPHGPESREILADEGLPEDAWWEAAGDSDDTSSA